MFGEMFGESFDLAAVASAAGLGGGALSAIVAGVVFKGFIMRFLAQMVMTFALTGVGFLALLHFLGFEIVPKDEANPLGAIPGIFSPQSSLDDPESAIITPQGMVQPERVERADGKEGAPIYYVKSPFRKS